MNEHHLFDARGHEGWDGLPRACTMTGRSDRGALVGFLVQGRVGNSCATGEVAGNTNVGELAGSGNHIGMGRTGRELMSLATFQDAWSISSVGGSAVWRIHEGRTMPLLRAFLSDVTLADRAVITADVNKVYDGNVAASGRLVISEGRLYGGKLGGGVFAFTDRNAGSNKTVRVSGMTVDGGNNGNNYAPRLGSTISPAPHRVIANGGRKSFDRIPYRDGVTYAGSAQGAVLPGACHIAPDGLSRANDAISFVEGALRIAGCGLALPEAMLAAACAPAVPGVR